MARQLRVVGLMNVQFAVKKEDGKPVVYVLEVNPRASRTVPFVAKATGVPVAKIAAKVMAGVTLPELGVTSEPIPAHVCVKESVFPFRKFAGVDIVLGPEMRSTGEVMGISERFCIAFAKSQLAAGAVLPNERQDLRQRQRAAQGRGRSIWPGGWSRWVTSWWPPKGPAQRLEEAGMPVTRVKKIAEGQPNLLDYLNDGADHAGHQHAQRQGRPHRRRPHPRRRRAARRALHHHDPSRRSRRQGDGSPARGRDDRAGAAGSLPQVG